MERSFVLVLTLVNLVTATPHGYGVKGGASAKAEASAVAGAFGDVGPIPLSIPAGSGYSGSFSKSSSSSFASSSASSSSSSYSFSGSGANGISGIGTDKGCLSGACSGTGNSGPSLNGLQQLTGANAASVAQAKASSGVHTPCQGSVCNGSPSDKCTSGQCLTDSTLKGQNGCTGNGNCQSPSSETELINGGSGKGEKDKHEGNLGDSNDFAVNINRNSQSKLAHDSNGQYSNKEKFYNPESDCSSGQCGPSNAGKSSLGGNYGNLPVPSTHLTTPNKNPPCTTPNCNYPSQNNEPQTGGLPSSYNVPIQSATNPPNTYYSPSSYGSVPNAGNNVSPGAPCTSPGCSSTPYNGGSSNIPNYHGGPQGSNIQGLCASGQCGIPSTSSGNANVNADSGVRVPNYSHGSIPSNVPSAHSGQPGCTTPHCSGLPTYSSLPTNQPGSGCSGAACSGPALVGTPSKPTDSNAPVYTGGFGGPAGFLAITPGSNKLPGSSAYDFGHNAPGTAGRPTGAFGSSPTQGSIQTSNKNKLNSNNNYGSTQTFSNGESTGNFDYNKPSTVPSTSGSQFNPSVSGSNTAHSRGDGIYKPITSHTGNSPSYSGGIDSSTGLAQSNSGYNTIHGSNGVTKPNIPSSSLNSPAYPGYGGSTSHDKTSPGSSSSSQSKPVYTGGFGGPTGVLNPNNINVPSNNPTVSSGNIPCANGNCGSKATPSSSQGSSLTGAHSLAAASASADAVAYSGGFGGPPGFLKPYDDGKVNIPAHGSLANGHNLSANNGHPAIPSATGKNLEPGSSVNGANAAAHASATASATAGGYGGNNNYQNNNGATPGCNTGCIPVGASEGFPDGSNKQGLEAGSVASAKSVAGANAYGIGGSFASSSASAHASAGSATKGGYGRK